MCTAMTYRTKDFYFGRTLDYDISYGETVAVMPRRFPISLRHMEKMGEHYAMIGAAHIEGDIPLFYDAANEKGLCMAGLNFVGNADYKKPKEGMDNVASFEFIPWILGQCATVREARGLLENINLVDTAFSATLPPARLHWIIADKDGAITVESVREGVKIYDNPTGVLTNNPPFDMQMFCLNHYMNLSAGQPQNHFSKDLPLKEYSRGMGALGLPGDLSSQSRFVRAAFVRAHAVSGDSEIESVSQFFRMMESVGQLRGCCEVGDGKYEITIYTSCCNAAKGIYYYNAYENHQITGIDMHKEDLSGERPVFYPMVMKGRLSMQN